MWGAVWGAWQGFQNQIFHCGSLVSPCLVHVAFLTVHRWSAAPTPLVYCCWDSLLLAPARQDWLWLEQSHSSGFGCFKSAKRARAKCPKPSKTCSIAKIAKTCESEVPTFKTSNSKLEDALSYMLFCSKSTHKNDGSSVLGHISRHKSWKLGGCAVGDGVHLESPNHGGGAMEPDVRYHILYWEAGQSAGAAETFSLDRNKDPSSPMH